MKLPGWLAFLVVVLLFPGLAGCGAAGIPGTGTPSAAVPARTATSKAEMITPEPEMTPSLTPEPPLAGTVSLWHSWDENERAALLAVINAFREQHPQVLFDVLAVPREDLLTRFEVTYLQGGGPALLLGPAEWGADLFERGRIVDATSLASPELIGQLNPAGLDALRYQDALTGLPYSLQGVVLYRNRSIITKSPATFDELVSSARESTQSDLVGAVLERSFFYSAAHLYGLGGKLLQADGTPAFMDEHGLAWINLLQSFDQAGPTEYNSDADLNQFLEGRVGFIIDGTWNMRVISDTIGAQFLAIDPWPFYGDGQLSGFVQSEAVYWNANAGAADQAAVKAFVEFFLSAEAQTILADAGFIPASTQASADDRLISQAVIALAGGTGYPADPRMQLYASALDGALRAVFFEASPPADALGRAAEEIQRQLQAAIATPKP